MESQGTDAFGILYGSFLAQGESHIDTKTIYSYYVILELLSIYTTNISAVPRPQNPKPCSVEVVGGHPPPPDRVAPPTVWFAIPQPGSGEVPSRKLTWKPKRGPIKTTVLLKGGYRGFHVTLGECNLRTLAKSIREGTSITAACKVVVSQNQGTQK